MMKEERISQRIDIELPAKFCFERKPDAWNEATVVNISTHGFCFRTDARYNDELNSKPAVRLAVELTNQELVELGVQVAWAGKTSSYNCLAGGEIMDPSGTDYQKVFDFYTKIFRDQSGKNKV